MKRLAVLFVMFAACKQKEIPYVPPPPDDAAPPIADAAEVTIDAAAPTAKPTATKIAVGDHVTCAVMSDTSVRCWGKNSNGQLGNGTTTDSATPVTVPLRGVVDVVIGRAHVCALLDDSSVTCWGRINYAAKGMLPKPTAVPGLRGAKRLFAVGTASCATLVDGPLVCWGDVDARGRPRLSAGSPETRAPTPMPDTERVTAITSTGILREDKVARWFGDAVEMPDIIDIAAAGEGLCGLRSDGVVTCAGVRHCAWKKKTPVPAIEELALPKARRLAFDVGTCVVTQNGKLQCLDTKDGCRADAPWSGLPDAEAVSGNCARTRTGGLRCWFVETGSRVVARVAGVARATALAGSSSHVCVLGNGDVICLGSNKHGALGRGEVDDRLHLDVQAVAF